MKITPFWTDTLSRPPLPIATLPDTVDVAIVGAGYTGLSAARVLAQQGSRTVVLERQTVGWGASSRNGGMALTGLKASPQEMSKRYGSALGRAFWEVSLAALDLVEQVVMEEGIACDFRRTGHLHVASKPAHFRLVAEEVAWYRRELGYTLYPLTPNDLRHELGTTVYYGGLLDEASAGLHPAKYVWGLAQAAARHGALLCEHCAVTRIEREAQGFRLHTSQGDLTAREVLIATNGYTDGLVPGIQPHVFSGGSYIIVTEPLSPALQAELLPNGRMVYDSRWFLNYFRLTPDGRMLFGGRNNLSPRLDLLESAQRLQAQMVRVFPALASVPVSHSWTGQLGLTFDMMPHVGRHEGIHYALGYCGHGVSIATYLGAAMGRLLAGQPHDNPFMQIPQETHFFYRGRAWFLPLAALYYRFLDAIS